jgi:hypothetical protein
MREPSNTTKVQLPQVGYGKPPEHTRFKTGRSGNPKGRPKGTLNMETVLARTLRAKVVVNENGKRRKITKLEAAIQQLTNKAASGDLKALHLLGGLVRSAEERSISTTTPNAEVGEADEMVIFEILKRLESTNKGDKADANEAGSK